MWESETGPSEYAVVWYTVKWKDIGEDNPKLKPSAADLAGIFSRLNGKTDSMEMWIDEMQPDLTSTANSMVATAVNRITASVGSFSRAEASTVRPSPSGNSSRRISATQSTGS